MFRVAGGEAEADYGCGDDNANRQENHVHLHRDPLLQPVFRLVRIVAALGILVRRRRPAALLFGASARAGNKAGEHDPANDYGQ